MSPPMNSSVNPLYLIIIIYHSTFGSFNTNKIICKNVEIFRKKVKNSKNKILGRKPENLIGKFYF